MAAADAPVTGTAEQGGQQFRTVKEGKATVLVPQGAKIGADTSEVQQVFYNPIQQFNRDLSVLAIKTYGEQTLEKKRANHARLENKKNRKRKRQQADEGDNPKAKSENPEAVEGTAKTTEGKDVVENSEQVEEGQTTTSTRKDPPFRILDALSASGLRALRYAHELPFVTDVTANDLSPSAAEAIKANVAHNGLEHKIKVNNDDALAVMYRTIADELSKIARHGNHTASSKWDVVDLDPYGTAAPFFDAAVQAVRDDGGLLCVTCTDSAIWAGHSYPEKTFSLYGGTPIKGTHSHEAGLRLIINSIASSAARYGLEVEPLLSLSIDFYTKVFVRVTKSPQNVKFYGAKTMLVYSCDSGCGAWETQYLMKNKIAPNKRGSGNFYKHSMAQGPSAEPLCKHCGLKTHLSGPMWGGPIHSPDFVRKLLEEVEQADESVYKTIPRLKGMLSTALEEHLTPPEPAQTVGPREDTAAALDPYPFYVTTGRLAGAIGCPAPPDDMFRGALAHLGYRTTRSHCRSGSTKTDAPWSTIWWVITEWIRQKAPVKTEKYKPMMPGYKILKDAGLLDKKPEDAEPAAATETASEDQDTKMEAPVDEVHLSNGNRTHPEATDGTRDEKLTEEQMRKTLVFDEALARLGRQSIENTQKLVRYPPNPEKNWGPLNRAQAH